MEMLRSIRKLIGLFSSGERARLGVILFLMLAAAGLEVVGVGMLPGFLLLLGQPEKVLAWPWARQLYVTLGIDSQEELMYWGAGGLMAVFVLKNVYLTAFTYAKARFAFNRQVSISRRLFRAYMLSPYAVMAQRNAAELLRNVGTEVGCIVTNMLLPAISVILDAMLILVIVGLLLVVEPWITLASVTVLGGAAVFFLLLIRRSNARQGREQQRARRGVLQALSQGFGGLKDARVLGRECFFERRFVTSARSLAHTACYRQVVSDLPRRVIELVALVGMVAVTVILIRRESSLAAAIPSLTLFAVASLRLMPLVMTLVASLSSLQFYRHSVDVVCDDLKRLEPLLELPQRGKCEARSGQRFQRNIRMVGVDYRYPGREQAAVRRVDLTIERGSVVGIVGASGAGKSTLVDLLLGLLTPQSGTIEVDGVSIHSNLRGWQRRLGYVPQTIYLTDDTIRKNIAFGLEDDEIDEERVALTVRAAQLERMLEELPQGLDTPVGERGVRLSGGQRQRIGIARALYHDPEVLILDEATSALDNETERYVIEAIESLRGDRTIVMIAHRLSTVRNCDVLHLFDAGERVASGTYEELIQGNVRFRAMAGEREVGVGR